MSGVSIEGANSGSSPVPSEPPPPGLWQINPSNLSSVTTRLGDIYSFFSPKRLVEQCMVLIVLVNLHYIKKAGTCLSKESLWTGPTAIDILPICTTPRMASRHTKPDCPSAVKKLSRFSLLDELPFCSGYFPSR